MVPTAELLTQAQAARWLGVSRQRIYQLVREGLLIPISLGPLRCIPLREIARYKRERHPPGRPSKTEI